jgi:hypothetical protein
MGNDLSAVNAARVSYDKEVDELSKEIRKGLKSRGLIENGIDIKCFKSFDWTNEQKKNIQKYKESETERIYINYRQGKLYRKC